jgi:hypothetical protein
VNDLRGSQAAPSGEKSDGFRPLYSKEGDRIAKAGAAGEAPTLEPRVSGRLATGAVFPMRHVEVTLRYARKDPLQFFKRLHVHGDLHGALSCLSSKLTLTGSIRNCIPRHPNAALVLRGSARCSARHPRRGSRYPLGLVIGSCAIVLWGSLLFLLF